LAMPQDYPYLLRGFSRFYFNEWNRTHAGPEQLRSLEVWWMREVTVPPGENPPPPEPILLGKYEAKPASEDPGWLVIAGTPRPAPKQPIDLMRGGVPVSWGRPGPDAPPIVSRLYPVLADVAGSEAAKYLLPGFAHYLLVAWNKERKPEERVGAVEVVRVKEGPGGGPKREVLARYGEEGQK